MYPTAIKWASFQSWKMVKLALKDDRVGHVARVDTQRMDSAFVLTNLGKKKNLDDVAGHGRTHSLVIYNPFYIHKYSPPITQASKL
jgi:hypothetical protein